MLEVKYSTRFKKDLKVCQKRHYDMNLLQQVINVLAVPAALQPQNKDHSLTGRSIGAAGCIVLGPQSGVSRNFHEKTPDVTHFQASNLCENHILLRGPVIYFREEEPEKGQAWRKCG